MELKENPYVYNLFDGCDFEEKDLMVKDVFDFLQVSFLQRILEGVGAFLDDEGAESVLIDDLLKYFKEEVLLTEHEFDILETALKKYSLLTFKRSE